MAHCYSVAMLDVHPPHKAIGSLSEFFLHLFTITVGLLIAVGIEGLVERHQHKELADSARQTMTVEIRKNAANVSDALRELADERKRMDANISAIAKAQLAPKGTAADDLNLDVSFGSTDVDETAWKAAQATAALSYMPYADAQRFSGVYASAEIFRKTEEQLAADEANFIGVVRRFHIGTGTVEKDAADAIAERLGVMQGHLFNIFIAAKVLQEQQNALLEGREPLHHMSEKMTN